MQAVPPGSAEASRTTTSASHHWLLLVLQLPARPSNARVKTWRRLQQLGAVPVKNAVYVLPYSTHALEDFSWLRTEIHGLKGQATVFSASSVDGVGDLEIVQQFRAARSADYEELVSQTRRLRSAVRGAGQRQRSTTAAKEARALRLRFDAVRAIDFFEAPHGADAERAVAELEAATRPAARPASADARVGTEDRSKYSRRIWVTRPRPGVDRFASAWLIQRFIDPDARFSFTDDPATVKNAVPFDMYDAGFRHEGARCTFEVLQHRFGIADPAVGRIGEIVHDIDLKEDAFHAPQVPTVAALVDGLRASFADDGELLRQGIALFQALYAGMSPSAPQSGSQSRSRRRPAAAR